MSTKIQSRAGLAILASDEHAAGLTLLAAIERSISSAFARPQIMGDHRIWQAQSAAGGVVMSLFERPFAVDRNEQIDIPQNFAQHGT